MSYCYHLLLTARQLLRALTSATWSLEHTHRRTTVRRSLLWTGVRLTAKTPTCTSHNIHRRHIHATRRGSNTQSQRASGRIVTP